ncbi:undecaprenyl-diphosphate phosphatase [Candidatus Shapirobacteria bacterium]|nr:undecaprenyl-diphosphate phosphatase [Candidatus Shapirobacteria bacterium]
MNFFQAIILSIVQGVTEFLPISSTGHINLLQKLFGLTPSLSFDIFLNTASLVAVIFFFRKKVPYFITNLRYIVVGTVPAIIAGVLFKDQIEALFSSTRTLPYEFIFTAITLFLTKLFVSKDAKLTYKSALIIGIFQTLAIIPAISRSGSTIFAGLMLGLSPLEAFSFSFGLFIPASFGALALDLKDISSLDLFSLTSISAFIVTALVSYISLLYLQKVLTNHYLWKFGFYCLALGLGLFFLI